MKTKLYSASFSARSLLLMIALVVFTGLNAFSQTFDRNYQDGRLYFKFKDNVRLDVRVNDDRSVDIREIPFVSALSSQYRLKELSRPYDLNNDAKLLKTFMLEIEDFGKIEEVIQKLGLEKDLEYVEKVPMCYIDYVPNDSLYNLYNGPSKWKWHLDVVQAEQAWDISRGSADIKVAVVDNAVWVDHPDLKDKIVAQRDTYYNTGNANPPSTGNPFDWSHGTHCAGLVGASSDNEIGIASIGFNVSLIAVKASNNNNPDGIYGYPGVQWAANNGADVISMSWGGGGYSATEQNMMNTLHNMGIVLLASAGNDNVSTPHYPSGYNYVISTASTNSDDKKSYFSNYGTSIDLCAPGGSASPSPDGLLSTTFNSSNLGYYDLMQGTSMATPFAAGLAGLILSVNPDLTPDQVEEIMKSTCDNIDAQNPDYIGKLGAGRINAFRAISNTPFEPTANFGASLTTILPGGGVDFTDLSTGVPSSWQWTFQGGTPSTSTEKNPSNIRFNSPGIYDVTLKVTNSFGTSTLKLEKYITVTNTPSPLIAIEASDNNPCIMEEVVLLDKSLYQPTSFQWEITPETHQYVNGTGSTSQNPQVVFLKPGSYSVSLTAANANGSSSADFEDFFTVAGAAPSFTVDMEDKTSGVFMLWDTIKSQAAVDKRGAHLSTYGIHLHGDPVPTGWSGSATGTTPEQAWGTNVGFHAKAYICGVDATGMEDLSLQLDLRQTYSLGAKFSWFRVLVNGEQLADKEGNTNFNPTTAGADEWKTLTFDLSPFAGQVFDVVLQSATRFADKNQGEGDNVFIDNISITNTTPVRPAVKTDNAFKVYPNPSDGLFTISSPRLTGNIIDIRVTSLLGTVVYTEKAKGNSSGLLKTLNLNNLPAGIYLLSVTDGQQQMNQRIVVR